MKSGNHYYKIIIHQPNQNGGANLDSILRKILKYLERKKKDSPQNPVKIEDSLYYFLRNGLRVVIPPNLNGENLEIRAAGDVGLFNKSVAAISRIYTGNFDVLYQS